MMSYTRFLPMMLCLASFILMVLAGCGTSNTPSEREYIYRSSLGNSTETDLRMKVPRFFSRMNYTLYRDEVTLDGTYFESEWRERSLFDDEPDMGISQARTKIIVTSRPLTAQATTQQRAFIEIFNQVYIEEEGGWVRNLCSPQTEEYFRDLTRRFRDDLESGVRTS